MIKDYMIVGEFDEGMTGGVAKDILDDMGELTDSRNPVIRLFIDSTGGYVHSLLSLLSVLSMAKAHGVVVETHVIGDAYSCGSMLAMSGTKGHRYISEFSHHLIHWGEIGSYSQSPKEAFRNSGREKAHFDMVKELYHRYANLPNLEKNLQDDSWYLSAKKSVKYGLADHIEKV